MFVSADKNGHIREAYPLNSDNAGLQDMARDQLLKWQLKPAVVDGSRVQVEVPLTFAFSTTLEGVAAPSSGSIAASPSVSGTDTNLIKVSPAIANSLRVKSYPPVYPQSLKERRVSGKVELKAVIGINGEIVSLAPISSNDPDFTTAAIAAVQHWAYKPYLLNGAPVEVETTIILNFQAR
jgi:TonB family protein